MGKINAKAGVVIWVQYTNSLFLKSLATPQCTFVRPNDPSVWFAGKEPDDKVEIPDVPVVVKLVTDGLRTDDGAVIKRVTLTVTVRPNLNLNPRKPEDVRKFAGCVPAYRASSNGIVKAVAEKWLQDQLVSFFQRLKGYSFEDLATANERRNVELPLGERTQTEIAGKGATIQGQLPIHSALALTIESEIANALEALNFLVVENSCTIECDYPTKLEDLTGENPEHCPIIEFINRRRKNQTDLEATRLRLIEELNELKRSLEQERLDLKHKHQEKQRELEHAHEERTKEIEAASSNLEKELRDMRARHKELLRSAEAEHDQNMLNLTSNVELEKTRADQAHKNAVADLDLQAQQAKSKRQLDEKRASLAHQMAVATVDLEGLQCEADSAKRKSKIDEELARLRQAEQKLAAQERLSHMEDEQRIRETELTYAAELLELRQKLPQNTSEVPMDLVQILDAKQQQLELQRHLNADAERAIDQDREFSDLARRQELDREIRREELAYALLPKMLEMGLQLQNQNLERQERQELLASLGTQLTSVLGAAHGMVDDLRIVSTAGDPLSRVVTTLQPLLDEAFGGRFRDIFSALSGKGSVSVHSSSPQAQPDAAKRANGYSEPPIAATPTRNTDAPESHDMRSDGRPVPSVTIADALRPGAGKVPEDYAEFKGGPVL